MSWRKLVVAQLSRTRSLLNDFFFERSRAAMKTVCVLRNGTFLVVLHVVLCEERDGE
jgi:hypothetical protein